MNVALARKFNPGLNQTSGELKQQFVNRGHVLEACVRTIALNTDSASNQHLLYYGPRGRGKTMLMARIEVEVEENLELSSSWLAVRLYEENYYEIASAGEFWLAVIKQFSQTRSIDSELRSAAAERYDDLCKQVSESNFDKIAAAVFQELLHQLPKHVVLIVENLQELSDELGVDAGWSVRHFLQNEPRLMLIATATSYFSNLLDAKHAFFELFHSQELKALNLTECTRLWNHLNNDDLASAQVRPLQILTGGSPRLLNVMAQFGAHRSIRELMEDLTGLIDERTDYFKSQIESLPSKERRVFIALADLWHPSTSAEIAARARQSVPQVSAQLNRLDGRGALIVDASQPRRKKYAIAERLFCIYYKLRSQREESSLVEALITFMTDFYPLEQHPGLRKEMLQLESFRNVVSKSGFGLNDFEVSKIDGARQVNAKAEVVEFAAAFEVLWEEVQKADMDTKELVRLYREFVERFVWSEELVQQEQLAVVLVNLAGAIAQQDDLENAVKVYGEVVDQFGSLGESVLQAQVAIAMYNLAVTIDRQRDIDSAMKAYGEVIDRFGSSEGLVLQEQVAKAMFNLAITMGKQGDLNGSMKTYGDVINRFDSSEELVLQEQVAKAMFNLAFTIGWQDDFNGKVKAFGAVVERFGSSEALVLQNSVAKAMFYLVFAMGQQGELDGEVEGYGDLIDRFGGLEHSEFKSLVLTSRVNKILCLGQLALWPELYVIASETLGSIVEVEGEEVGYAKQLINLVLKLDVENDLDSAQKSQLSKLCPLVKAAPDNKTARMEMWLGLAVILSPEKLIQMIDDLELTSEMQPLLVYLNRKNNTPMSVAQEIEEIADDVAERVEALSNVLGP